jgi:hypothetical protein
MAKQSISITPEFLERRNREQFGVIKRWLFGPDPDPTYDRLNGWKLDQFAMTFLPDLVREYKRVLAEGHPHAALRDPLESRNPWEWIEWSSKLKNEIMRQLLNARFRVEGYRLQSDEPTVIPEALLEHMSPDIETSELREINGATETARWFEKVRVFDLAAAAKPSAGRKPTYDWSRLVDQLEQENPVLATKAELVAYCGKIVTANSGKHAQKDGPDDKTIRAAISKFGLEKFIKPT